jgi:hypothetical protein
MKISGDEKVKGRESGFLGVGRGCIKQIDSQTVILFLKKNN